MCVHSLLTDEDAELRWKNVDDDETSGADDVPVDAAADDDSVSRAGLISGRSIRSQYMRHF